MKVAPIVIGASLASIKAFVSLVLALLEKDDLAIQKFSTHALALAFCGGLAGLVYSLLGSRHQRWRFGYYIRWILSSWAFLLFLWLFLLIYNSLTAQSTWQLSLSVWEVLFWLVCTALAAYVFARWFEDRSTNV